MASLGSDFLGFNEAIEKKNMASKAPLFDPIYLFLKYLSDRTKKPSLLWKIKKKKEEEEGRKEIYQDVGHMLAPDWTGNIYIKMYACP